MLRAILDYSLYFLLLSAEEVKSEAKIINCFSFFKKIRFHAFTSKTTALIRVNMQFKYPIHCRRENELHSMPKLNKLVIFEPKWNLKVSHKMTFVFNP